MFRARPFWTLLLFSILIYLPALKAPFIFDDYANIVRNPDIKQISNLKDRIFFRFSAIRPNQNLPNRPLTFALFTIEYSFFGLNPMGWRALSLLMHGLCAWLIFRLSQILFVSITGFPQIFLAWAAALLFAAHPVHMDAVAYVSNQSDLLAALFCLSSLLLFASRPAGEKFRFLRYPLSIFSFALALGAKETAAVFPALLLCFDFLTSAQRGVKALARRTPLHAPFWILAAAYVALRKIYFGKIGFLGENLESLWNPFNYALTQAYATLRYLQMVLVPVGQAVDHLVMPVQSAADPRFWVPAAAWAAIACAAALYLRRVKNSPVFWVTAFAALWTLAGLFPTSSVFPIFDALVERRLYFCGWGLSLLLLSAHAQIFEFDWRSEWSPSAQKKMAAFLAAHILLLGGWTFARGFLYRDPARLWQEALNRYPQNSRAYNNLGGIYHERGDFAQAEQAYRRALAQVPDNVEALSNLAVILYQNGDAPQAYALLQRILELRPEDSKAHYALGRLFFDQGDAQRAKLHYEEAIRIQPGFAEAHANLAAIYFRAGDTRKTRELLEKAIRLSPDYAMPRINLGILYFHDQKPAEAERYFREAIALDPFSAEAHKSLGDLLLNQNQTALAEAEFLEAVKIDPDYSEAHDALGHLYYQQGRWDPAQVHYEKVLQRHPERAAAYSNLAAVHYQKNEEAEAEAGYRKAVELDPTLYPVYGDLGAIYENQGKFDLALRYYEKALKLNPGHVVSLENLGDYYRGRKKFAEALRYYEKILKLEPQNLEVRKKAEEVRSSPAKKK